MNPRELSRTGLRAAPDPLEPHSAERERDDERARRAEAAARAARDRGPVAWLLEGPGWTILRPALDLTLLVVAVILVVRQAGDSVSPDAALSFVLFPPLVLVMLGLRGMYARRLRVSLLDGVVPVLSAVSFAAMVLIAAEVYVFTQELATAPLAHLWGAGLAAVGLGQVVAAFAQRVARSRTLVGRPAIIVGAGLVGGKVARRLQDNPDYGLRPIGFLDPNPPHEDRIAGLSVLGGHEDIDWIASLTGAEHVVLAFSQSPDEELVAFAQRCSALGLEVSVVPRLFEALNERMTYEAIGGLPLMALRPTRPHGRQFAVKHALDRLLAAGAIAVLTPVLLAIALLVRWSSPGPVLFRQRRIGRDGKTFDLLKFRSMRPPRPGEEFALANGTAPGGVEGVDRRTAIGRLLRRTSLDELPQLLNVLRGDMSIVGPRPERPEFVELFTRDVSRYAERHRVRSGITGWAQVHGLRGQTSLGDRVEWDNFYIEHWSLALDAKIIALTLIAVLRRAE